jgi:hypothetical protein
VSKYLIFGVIILILVVGIFMVKILPSNSTSKGIADIKTSADNATPAPTFAPTPEPIQYDSSTDLKKELDSVDPSVSNDDFTGLVP